MRIDRKRAGYLEGVVSIVVNTVLFVVKYYYGVLFNSIAVIADSVHTLSDSLTSVVVVVGFRVAYIKPDEEHPFGHGRAEEVAAIIIGVLLCVVGYEFAVSSYNKLVSRETLVYSLTLVLVLLVSAVIKEVLAMWAFRLGEKFNSESIRGDAWHHRSDAIATGLLALAILTAGGTYWWVDGVMGLVVSAFIVVTGGKIVLDASSVLLGRAPSREEVEEIVSVVKKVSPKVQSVHHIHVHKYGEHTEVTLHVHLPDDMSLSEAHEIATLIEEVLRKELGYEATVHVEPASAKRLKNHAD
ncbi:cation diffusion facilitator family transporter [Thermogladius sp. KZ2Tp1]|uniref:cation diffusion facilitator family transporter n=1 Tax=Thermogladius sp. KZ2Tp1 TaxID=3136289 RepID=UPI003DA8FF2A